MFEHSNILSGAGALLCVRDQKEKFQGFKEKIVVALKLTNFDKVTRETADYLLVLLILLKITPAPQKTSKSSY